MDTNLMVAMAKGIAPCVIAGCLACTVVVAARKGKPLADGSMWWVVPALLGAGCAVGAGWSGGTWRPGAGATSWLAVMACVAGAAGCVPRGPVSVAVRALALCAVIWMTVRSIAVMGNLERAVIIAGGSLLWSAVCEALERIAGPRPDRPAWYGAAVGLIVAGAASQVLVIGMTVQTAAWMAAGVAAFFGVCLATALGTRRVVAGNGAMLGAGVLLCGLLVHGWQTGAASDKPWEAGLMGGLLALSAAGPLIVAGALKGKGRTWGGLVACAVPAAAAVIVAVVVRPPPFDA